MLMNVEIHAIGLTLRVECEYVPYEPGCTSGPPDRCYPPEGGYAEITDLKCGVHDASFLLTSDLKDEIEEAAYQACVDAEESRAQDALESKAERYARWEDAA